MFVATWLVTTELVCEPFNGFATGMHASCYNSVSTPDARIIQLIGVTNVTSTLDVGVTLITGIYCTMYP